MLFVESWVVYIFYSPQWFLFFSETSTLAVRAREALERLEKTNGSAAEHPHNWTTEWFKTLLLSTRDPLASSITISLALTVPLPPSSFDTLDPQIWASASILYATTVFASSDWTGESPLLTPMQQLYVHQFQNLVGTFQQPGHGLDELKTTPRELVRHALIWKNGVAWKIHVKDDEGNVFSIMDIYSSLKLLNEKTSEVAKEEISFAALSWLLSRDDWATVFNHIEALPINGKSIVDLRSSLATLALEDYPAVRFASTAELMEDVRTGSGSPNRYADQTLRFIAYRDGRVGVTINHVAGDCGVLVEISSTFLSILRQANQQETINQKDPKRTKAPEPLRFVAPPDIPASITIPSQYRDSFARLTKVFDLSSLVSHKPTEKVAIGRLIDAILNFTFQYALYRTCGYLEVIFQPVWQRNFHQGRVEPMFPVTPESKMFIQSLLDASASPPSLQTRSELFASALGRRREIIKEAVAGTGTHYFKQGFLGGMINTVIEAAESGSPEADHLKVLEKAWEGLSEGGAGEPRTIHFTGFTLKEEDVEIDTGLTNIYQPNHLVLFYLFKPSSGTATVTVSSTGLYQAILENLVLGMKEGYSHILEVALHYCTKSS